MPILCLISNGGMEPTNGVHKVYVDGEAMEIWENPDAPFNTTTDEIREYYNEGKWVLLFNAMVLNALSEYES